MRRFVKTCLAVLSCLAFLVPAGAQEIRSLDIMVTLEPDGSAEVAQVWKVSVVSGTEWYIPIENLHGIEVDSLKVWEGSTTFVREGHHWNSDRSREEKAGRCGIIDKSDGVELCWGQGAYGDHEWVVSYKLRNLVQGYDDFDGFNFMFVNPEMIAGVDSLWLFLRPGKSFQERWTRDNTRFWGFGFDGDLEWAADSSGVVVTNSAPMSRYDDVIVMMEFNKGLFQPALVNMEDTFAEHRDRALEGSDYYEEKDPLWATIFAWVVVIGLILLCCWPVVILVIGIFAAIPWKKLFMPFYSKSYFGKGKISSYWRDIPLDGNLPAAWWLFKHGTRDGVNKSSEVMGALFLRWIFQGRLEVAKQPDSSEVNLAIVEGKEAPADEFEGAVFKAVRSAAGENRILEAGELKKATLQQGTALSSIASTLEKYGNAYMQRNHLLATSGCSEQGKQMAEQLVGLKNFLNDFTLSKERYAEEVKLWKEYLVYAQFFGISEKVAKQFRELIPKDMENAGFNSKQLLQALSTVSSYSSKVFAPPAPVRSHSSYSSGSSHSYSRSYGGGGHSSHSGGGGHSGGGRGGGSR